ncbi:hypothetical protein ccbrp13_50610 [Ktedonobacteria bacterium brp13]|nr:hypothetical protein ccbrp13_50610 [Ktedonobacteria bacterium brp13]
MLEKHMSLLEVRQQLNELAQQLKESEDTVVVVNQGENVLTILSFTYYQHLRETVESLQHTLDILHDEKIMTAYRMAQKNLNMDDLLSLQEIERQLASEDAEITKIAESAEPLERQQEEM